MVHGKHLPVILRPQGHGHCLGRLEPALFQFSKKQPCPQIPQIPLPPEILRQHINLPVLHHDPVPVPGRSYLAFPGSEIAGIQKLPLLAGYVPSGPCLLPCLAQISPPSALFPLVPGVLQLLRILPVPGLLLHPQQSQKMPFPLHSVGKKTHRRTGVHAAFSPLPKGNWHRLQHRIPVKKPPDIFLILPDGKGAGRVQQVASRQQHFHCPGQNLPLQRHIIFRAVFLPDFHQLRVPAEHAFPGAGRIHQNPVEKRPQHLGQLPRAFAGDTHIADAGQLQILKKGLSPGAADIIGHQKTLSLQPGSQLRTFPPWRGAQIQNPVSRLHRQNRCRSHGTGLLKIIQPRIIVRVPGRAPVSLHIISVGCPGNLPGAIGTDRLPLLWQKLCGIDPETGPGRLPVASQPGLILAAQHLSHFCQKCLR